MTDSTAESTDGQQPKRRSTWRIIPGVNTRTTPVTERFDPPLEHRPYDEIYDQIRAALAAIEKRRFGRKRFK